MGKRDETFDHKWEMQFFELKKFKKKFGHCDIPQHGKKYSKLANWCVNQRKWKKFRSLEYDPERERKLTEIGFSWDIRDKWFEKNFNKLKAFIFQHGHSSVFPSQDKSLHKWCTHLREDKKNNQERLTTERIKQLESIGFDWNPPENFYEEFHFNERLTQLKEFVLKHQRYPPSSDKKYPFLSTWVERQRYDKRYGFLSKEHKKKLDEFGFRWEPYEENWENHLEELKLFKNKFGHCNVPHSKSNRKYFNLADWCTRQRESYKDRNKSLTKDRIQKLNRLEFSWTYPLKPGELVRSKTSNETLLRELIRLHKKLGRTPSLKDLKQYSNYKKGQYELRFGNFGNAITQAGLINSDEEFWINKFIELKKFLKNYNRYPSRSETQFQSLTFWILNQRQLKKRGELSAKRIKLLDSINFSWNTFDDSWEINFEKLKSYKEKFGHCHVPESNGIYERLGSWVGIQRRHYARKNNILTTDRIQKLNNIGFNWKSTYKSK